MPFAQPRQPERITTPPSISPGEFFQAAHQTALKAESVCGGIIDRYYLIGGQVVRLRFAGAGMLPHITPAIEHLAVEPEENPSLTIHIWDSETTGVHMPPAPWDINYDVTFRGDVRGFSNERFRTAYQAQAGLLSMLDMESGIGIYWGRDPELLPTYIRAVPLHYILHWWLRKSGLQIVHAAALSTPDGGVLLAGKGGSGKSTTALNCLNAGFAYAGDDYSLVSAGPEPMVHSLYNSGKTFTGDLEHLPFLAPLIANPEEADNDKALYFLHQHFPEKLARSFPLRALLLPRVTGKPETTLRLASPAAAILAVAPSTVAQLAGAGQEAHQLIIALASSVPCYHLELGTERERIPGVIRDLLAERAAITP